MTRELPSSEDDAETSDAQVPLLRVPATQRRLLLVRPPRPTEAPGLAQRLGRGASKLLVRAADAVPPYAPAAVAARGLGKLLAKPGEAAPGLGALVERWVGQEDPWELPPAQRETLGLTVVETELTAGLWLPPGHPRVGHLYAVHPLRERAYLPLERYHPVLFEQKLQEALTLLAALGAVRVRARCARGYSAFKSAGVSVGTGRETLGVDATRTERSVVGVELEEHYPAGRTPTIPRGLLWLGHEPAWTALARRRLESGVERFTLELRYTEDFGVHGGVAAALEGLGVRVGGAFREFEETVWHLEGEFG